LFAFFIYVFSSLFVRMCFEVFLSFTHSLFLVMFFFVRSFFRSLFLSLVIDFVISFVRHFSLSFVRSLCVIVFVSYFGVPLYVVI